MGPTALRIAAADGYALGATLFPPATPNDRVVVVNAAMGVKRGFYAPFALHLAARGFTVVSYDYRGIGDSRPPRLRLATRAYSFSDDHFAPRPAVDALLGFYRGATAVAHRHVTPAELGLRRIGHFGFFRESCSATLWADADAWLEKA